MASIRWRAPAQTIINGGKSRIQGIEFDGQVTPVDGLRLSAGYTYLDTKLKPVTFATIAGYAPVEPTSQPGGSLVLSPKHKLTATAAYMLPIDEALVDVTASATYTYTAKQLASNDTPIGVLPATNLLNLNLSWNSIAVTPIDLLLFATNVTNEKYPVFVGGSFQSAGFDSYVLGQPRMYGMRLRYSFGR